MKKTITLMLALLFSLYIYADPIELNKKEPPNKGVDNENDRSELIVPTATIENGRNHEYEFFTIDDPDGRYMYIWTIYEERDNEQDAVELGKATMEHRDSENRAYITFLRSGLYTISVDIYTGDDEFVDRYTCQANVL